MKRIIALLLAALMAVSLAACSKDKSDTSAKYGNVDAEKETEDRTEVSTENEMVESGGWTTSDSVTVTDELKALFVKANAILTGAQYEPVALLGTQVVAGTNYLVLCKETPTVPDAISTYVLVTLYEDLQGNAEITDAKNSGVSAPEPYDPENPVSGGWGEPTTPEVTDEARAALEKACESATVAAYEPKALLATQVVAGYNYQLLCKVTAADLPEYVIITVYADLDGGAEITETIGFDAGDDAGQPDEKSEDNNGEELSAVSEAE